MKEIDLNLNPTKQGLLLIEKIQKIVLYLYAGNTLKYNSIHYRMDADFNVYAVSVDENGNPKPKGEETFPLFVNENFWDLLVAISSNIDEETFGKIKLECAILKTLN